MFDNLEHPKKSGFAVDVQLTIFNRNVEGLTGKIF